MQSLEQLDPFGDLLADLFALGFGHRDLQHFDLLSEIHFRQRFAHGFRAHLGEERLGAVGFAGFAILMFAQQLILLERRLAWIDHDVILVIDDALELAGAHVEHQA